MSERQLTEFADKHARQIPFDTSPRHLAGPGDARHVTHGLAAAGWTRTSDPLSAHLVMTSPDHRHLLQFTPKTGSRAPWWQVSAVWSDSGPYWQASFGALVPAEVLSAMTDALVTSPPAEQPDPWQAVDAAGWVRAEDGTARSADGLCVIDRRQLYEGDDARGWSVEARGPGDEAYPGPLIWHAWFRPDTPAHLVNAFVTGLTDTRPLQRGQFDMTGHHSVVQERSPLTPEQVVAAHTERIQAITAQDRAARRRQRLSTTPAPAHRTGTAPPRR